MLKRSVSVVAVLWALLLGGMLLATIVNSDDNGRDSQATLDARAECDRRTDSMAVLDCYSEVADTATYETTYSWQPFTSPASSVRERWATVRYVGGEMVVSRNRAPVDFDPAEGDAGSLIGSVPLPHEGWVR